MNYVQPWYPAVTLILVHTTRKLDRVGPVKNRPSTNLFHQLKKIVVTCDRGQVTGDKWQVTGYRWQVTHDTWQVVKIVSKFHVPSSGGSAETERKVLAGRQIDWRDCIQGGKLWDISSNFQQIPAISSHFHPVPDVTSYFQPCFVLLCFVLFWSVHCFALLYVILSFL